MSLFPDPVVEHPRCMARLTPDTINDGQQRDRRNDATADRIVPQHSAGAACPQQMTGRPMDSLVPIPRTF
ncbi:hypothetical protein TSH100_25180 [Azospirillum sp. TSH100]|nr:hypothetical protein TSH100_25180 [Azospirillum sp. TSH100]